MSAIIGGGLAVFMVFCMVGAFAIGALILIGAIVGAISSIRGAIKGDSVLEQAEKIDEEREPRH